MINRSQSIFIFLLISVIVGSALLTRPNNNQGIGSIANLPSENNSSVMPTPISNIPAGSTPTSVAGVQASSPDEIDIGPDEPGFYAMDMPLSSAASSNPAAQSTAEGWSPPPMEVPIAHNSWDHYWLKRPVDPNHNDFPLPYYTFGSDGAANDLRIHHGVDLANPIGVEVHAAGDGTVIWAGKGSLEEDGYVTAYGSCVVIQHDFGYDGQPIFTLYAHLSAILIEKDQRVESGQLIGLIGNTGQVSGPHVHFEVRIGHNRYDSVYNPLLWMAPYVGTGVIAGRVTIDDKVPSYDATITLIDRATGKEVYQTTSYAGKGVQSDPNWKETFVIPDIPEGKYLVTATSDAGRWSGDVEVVAGTTNWVEMVRKSTTRTGNDTQTSPPNATPEP
jgi:peptidase M23-like protein